MSNTPTTIAVASGKGGVGKSTVAALLALAYAEQGFEVALLDADLYGPSIPTLFHFEGRRHEVNQDQKVIPIRYGKLQLVSFGFILGQLPAIMRGPMIARYTTQLLNDVCWEPHQLLIIDLPPGTGDIHLTVTQSKKIDSAVIVTTPHALSFSDVGKAILMLNKVKVPITGFVLNMSYFVCDQCHKKHHIFGTSTVDIIAVRFGIPALASLPLDRNQYGQRILMRDPDTDSASKNTSAPNTNDVPAERRATPQADTAPETQSAAEAPADRPATPQADAAPKKENTNDAPAEHHAMHSPAISPDVRELAASLWKKTHSAPRPEITIANSYEAIEITDPDGKQYRITPYRLRCACRCALCYDEYRDVPLRMRDVPENIFAEQIKIVGNYALYIKWSDGHDTGFFPLDYIYTLCRAQAETTTEGAQSRTGQSAQ